MTTVSTQEEYVPGIREQAKGVKINSESLFRPLKACITGTADWIYLPDADFSAIANLLAGNADEDMKDYLRKHAGKNLKDVDPEMYEKCKAESDALAKAYRDNGVQVIRNESGKVPDELIEWQTGWGGPRYLSLFASGAGEVIGNVFVNAHEIPPNQAAEVAHRDAMREIFANDPEAVWLTMPQLYPSHVHPTCRPYTSPGDFRVFPNKLCLIGIGVAEESHIHDRSKPRCSGDEEGLDILRRMMEPYGWRVEPLYFNSKYTYHIDCAVGPVAEGVVGVPTGGPGPCLWHGLPDELKDWEIIDVEWDEHKIDACNCVVVDEKKVVIPADAVKFGEEISRRGYEPVPVPYSNITHMTGSGIQCSTMILERE